MTNPAEVTDLEAVWPFPSAVPDIAQAKLDQAWRALQAESEGVEARMTSGVVDPAVVTDVLVSATIRMLSNPEGHAKGSVSIDDYQRSWELGDRAKSDDLYFTSAELRRVGGGVSGVGAFTIRPAGTGPCWT